MKKIAVERRNNLSPEDFERDFLQGAGKPLIVTDAMDDWPARTKWTFEFLRDSYGSDFVTAPLGLYSDVAKLTRVSAYIDHLDSPADELPGFWVNIKDGTPQLTAPGPSASPPYLLGWCAFQKHPELYEDIKPSPYFVSDWLLALNPRMLEIFEWTCGREYWSVYVGPEGTLSKLHQDFWHTHSYLAQVQGRKRAILFSPEDSRFLYDGKVDPEQPDLERHGDFDKATAYECVIEPGEMLFMPGDWWHCVRALEKSITVSHCFYNDTNVNEHLAGIMKKLPKLAAGFRDFPEWRDALGVKWSPSDFSDL